MLGFDKNDNPDVLDAAAKKILKMRIFDDNQGRMNLSALDKKAEILIVPNFTLSADIESGNRPSFSSAAEPAKAGELFELLKGLLEKSGLKIISGVFGASMSVNIKNDGPVTFVINS